MLYFFLIHLWFRISDEKKDEWTRYKRRKKQSPPPHDTETTSVRPKCAVCSGVVSFFSFPFCTPHNIYITKIILHVVTELIFIISCFVLFLSWNVKKLNETLRRAKTYSWYVSGCGATLVMYELCLYKGCQRRRWLSWNLKYYIKDDRYTFNIVSLSVGSWNLLKIK